jgi:hypothetical protein
MMPHEPVLDIMRRTMANLAFIEQRASTDGPFEVTQLINSFLGALAHPWETLWKELNSISISDAERQGWPIPRAERPTDQAPTSLGDLIHAFDRMVKLACELGLTPVSRTRAARAKGSRAGSVPASKYLRNVE